jgi:hypothetical protein
MPRHQTREVPRWRRGGPPQKPQQVIQVRGRQARALVRQIDLGDRQAVQAGGQPNGAAAGNDVLARTGAWRNRRMLPPFAWGVMLAVLGAVLRGVPHPVLSGMLASLAVPALMILFTRHLSAFARRWTDTAALAASVWLPVLAATGFRSPVPALLALTWVPFAAVWARHYRIRPEEAKAEQETRVDTTSDTAVWARLAAKRKWSAWLTDPEVIPGGVKYRIEMDGVETHVGNIMAEPRAIAAAYRSAQTEAYVEPHPTGIESKGTFTKLRAGTLQAAVEWDGRGFTADGLARVARFADSQPVRIRAWIPRDGARHGMVSGTMGAGKSALLDLLIWLALRSAVPVVPIVLDPQNGQSLPQWRGKVIYAAGVDECVRMRRALNAAMMDRSRRLASMTWDDDGFKAKGMQFFDARLSGLPIVMPITDEAPLLLSGGESKNPKLAAEMTSLTADAGKLGRKAGESEWIVTQVPSLAELGGDQALRAMFVGGSVIGLRSGDRVSGGMVGLQTDPFTLPKYFPDGSPTQGIGYAATMDNRQAPMRTDLVPSRMRHQAVTVPQLEPEFLEAMDRAMGTQGILFPPAAAPVVPSQSEAPADDGPEGRRCTDAVLLVLAEAGRELDRGEIIQWAGNIAVDGWGRAKPFSIKSVGNALRDLTAAGRVTRVRDGVYQAAENSETIINGDK